MTRLSKELKKYSKKFEDIPNESHARAIHEMIENGVMRIGSSKWTNFFAEVSFIDVIFDWYYMIQVAENAVIVGTEPTPDLIDSLQVMSRVKKKFRKSVWQSLKGQTNSESVEKKVLNLQKEMIENKTPYLSPKIIRALPDFPWQPLDVVFLEMDNDIG